jgi:hypothetical protein
MPTPNASAARKARADAHSRKRNARANAAAAAASAAAEERREEEFERTRPAREAARAAAEAAAEAANKARNAKEAEEMRPMTLTELQDRYGDIGRAREVLRLMEERRKALAAAEKAAEEAAEEAGAAVEAGDALAKQMKGLSIGKSGGGYTRRTKGKKRRTRKIRR